jgi:hypothetical protein
MLGILMNLTKWFMILYVPEVLAVRSLFIIQATDFIIKACTPILYKTTCF